MCNLTIHQLPPCTTIITITDQPVLKAYGSNAKFSLVKLSSPENSDVNTNIAAKLENVDCETVPEDAPPPMESKPQCTSVEPVTHDYLCPICQEILHDPILTECCGHRYCKRCMDHALRVSQQCPMCRASGFRVLPDKRTQREIGELEVRCEEAGCSWTGKYRELPDHPCSGSKPTLSMTMPQEGVTATSYSEPAPGDSDFDTAAYPEDTYPSPPPLRKRKKQRVWRKKRKSCSKAKVSRPVQKSVVQPQNHPELKKSLPHKGSKKRRQKIQRMDIPTSCRRQLFKREQTLLQPPPGRELKGFDKETGTRKKAVRAKLRRRYVRDRKLRGSPDKDISKRAAQFSCPYVAGNGTGSTSSSSQSKLSGADGDGKHKGKTRSHRKHPTQARSSGINSGNAGNGSDSEDDKRERKISHQHEVEQKSSDSASEESEAVTSNHEDTKFSEDRSRDSPPRTNVTAVTELPAPSSSATAAGENKFRKITETVPSLPHTTTPAGGALPRPQAVSEKDDGANKPISTNEFSEAVSETDPADGENTELVLPGLCIGMPPKPVPKAKALPPSITSTLPEVIKPFTATSPSPTQDTPQHTNKALLAVGGSPGQRRTWVSSYI